MTKVNKTVSSVADCLATLTLTQVKTDDDIRSILKIAWHFKPESSI